MPSQKKRDRESLKDLAFGASDEEMFGARPEDSDRGEPDAPSPGDRDAGEPGSDTGNVESAAENTAEAERPPPSEGWRKEIERLFAEGKWQQVCKRLGPPEEAEDLPPELALLYATALKESDPEAAEANVLAIRAMAELLDVSPGSQTAVIVAKRILRRNPAAWTTRAAPPAPTRIVLVVMTVLIGAVIGWLLGPSGIRIDEVLKEALR